MLLDGERDDGWRVVSQVLLQSGGIHGVQHIGGERGSGSPNPPRASLNRVQAKRWWYAEVGKQKSPTADIWAHVPESCALVESCSHLDRWT